MNLDTGLTPKEPCENFETHAWIPDTCRNCCCTREGHTKKLATISPSYHSPLTHTTSTKEFLLTSPSSSSSSPSSSSSSSPASSLPTPAPLSDSVLCAGSSSSSSSSSKPRLEKSKRTIFNRRICEKVAASSSSPSSSPKNSPKISKFTSSSSSPKSSSPRLARNSPKLSTRTLSTSVLSATSTFTNFTATLSKNKSQTTKTPKEGASSSTSSTIASLMSANARPASTSDDKIKVMKKRMKVVNELYETEKTYVQQLTLLIENFMKPIQASKTFPEDLVKLLFRNLQSLCSLHEDLLSELSGRLANSQRIGDVLLKTIPYLKMYVTYVNTFDQSQKSLGLVLQENARAAAVLDQCKSGSYSGRLGLSTLRVVPIQRIPRYLMLLRELKELTPETHVDYENVKEAFLAVSDMAQYIENSKKQFDMIQKMALLKQGLTAENLKSFQDSAYSMKEAKKTHDWGKKTANPSSVCWFCEKSIATSLPMYHCQKCGIDTHKGCRKLIAHNCGSGATKEHPIPLQACEGVYQKLSTSGTSRGKTRNVTAFLFPDSIVIVAAGEPKPPSGSKTSKSKIAHSSSNSTFGSSIGGSTITVGGGTRAAGPHYDFVLVIKWYSRKTKRRIDVLADKESPSLVLLEPRGSDCHSLTFRSTSVCELWQREVNETIKRWFEKEELARQQALADKKERPSLSEPQRKSKNRLSMTNVGKLIVSQSAPVVSSKNSTIRRR